jgi:hypothetical protein
LDVDLLGSIQICTLLDGVQQECVSGAEIAILSVAGMFLHGNGQV